MATELTVAHYCDICLSADGRRADVEYSTALDVGNGMVLVELCNDHAPAVRDALELVARYAVPVVPEPRVPAAVRTDAQACPICGKRYTSPSGVRTHLRNTHRVTAQEYLDLGLFPQSARLDPLPCPAAGCDFVAVGVVGLGAHTRAKHPEG